MIPMPPFAIELLEPRQGWPADLSFAIDAPVVGAPLHALAVNLRGFVVPKVSALMRLMQPPALQPVRQDPPGRRAIVDWPPGRVLQETAGRT
jgi:hypothetical protein